MVQYLDVGDERPVSDIVPPCFAKIGVWMLPARPVCQHVSPDSSEGTHRVRSNPAAGVVPRMSGGVWVFSYISVGDKLGRL